MKGVSGKSLGLGVRTGGQDLLLLLESLRSPVSFIPDVLGVDRGPRVRNAGGFLLHSGLGQGPWAVTDRAGEKWRCWGLEHSSGGPC